MIITRAPFRITLGGGGTDLPSFYKQHGGFILAVGIDKYMYLNLNTPIVDDLIRVRYNRTELVHHVDELQHTLAREALRHFQIETGVEVVSIADIPAGTGLGSSSCYLVALLNALHALTHSPAGFQQLAEEACQIELEILAKPIGKQDQYMAAFGGLTALDIDTSGRVTVTRVSLEMEILEALESNTLLFYTGEIRDATAILASQDKATRQNDPVVVGNLTEIRDIGREIYANILEGNLRKFGKLMDHHWQLKKKLSTGISNPVIDDCYQIAKANGAIGGKITGAGGGGFLMLYCEDRKSEVRTAMKKCGLRELNFRFDFEGCKVIFDITSRDGRLAHMLRQEKQNGRPLAAIAN